MSGRLALFTSPVSWLSLALLCAQGAFADPARAQTPVLLESATLGATGLFGGTSITENQYVGWRFEIDTPLEVDAIGGHLLGLPDVGNDLIFGALIRLAAIDAFPAGDPFTPEETVAAVTFQPPLPSVELLVPLSVTLEPGPYALVFGSDLFGATGNGAIPNTLDQTDILPTTADSYIFYGIPDLGAPPIWRGPLASQMRFLVRGTTLATVPTLDAAGLGALAALLGLAGRLAAGTQERALRC
ncbi:MAG: hypothetical protein QNK04_33100 [Myxococcota bacterium]|nr:hypothetical protein [Myxococcota bacterium]